MELPQQKQKLKTIIPHHNKAHDNIHIMKHKSSHKLNISDYIVEKKKRLPEKLSQKFGDLILDLNKKHESNIKESYIRRSSYINKPKIKKVLLKDYKEQIRREKKYRKLKIIENLYDSSEDDSADEDQNIGLELYINSESNFILGFDILMVFFTFYLLIFIPTNLAERKNYFKQEKKINSIFNFIAEILYILDLFLCFFRSYYNFEYKKITVTKEIITNYITNDFLLDLFRRSDNQLS